MIKTLFDNSNYKNFIKTDPEKVLNISFHETVKMLSCLMSKEDLKKAFDINIFYPSPVKDFKNGNWIKKNKIIGINPRIARTYFGIIKYAMTFPEESIHIMPLWEPGCDGSIYSRINWKLSEKWLDPELSDKGFDSPEKQLKLVINLLHALGKTVGFDAVPHTDKYAEEVFISPEFFEWVKLNPQRTKQLSLSKIEYNNLYEEVKTIIRGFLENNGDSNNIKIDETLLNDFYSDTIDLNLRSKLLFGLNPDTALKRRLELINLIRGNCFETIPVFEHSPCRPILFDKIVSNKGLEWAEFKVKDKPEGSVVFNSVTPYKWYEIDDQGYINIEKPNLNVWQYFIDEITNFQSEYNFDFLRADMAHVQISHSHSNKEKHLHYDNELWKKVKENVQRKVPYFATFAESFLNEYYIDAVQDMKNKAFDIILGMSNYTFLNNDYIDCIKRYRKIATESNVSPCISMITGDSDKPAGTDFWKSPNAIELRYFTMLFLDLPGYSAMGIEKRELIPKSDEEFSGLFTLDKPFKYKWGENINLLKYFQKIRKLYPEIQSKTKSQTLKWFETGSEFNACWGYYNKKNSEFSYIFMLNIDTQKSPVINLKSLTSFIDNKKYYLKPVYSVLTNLSEIKKIDLAKSYLCDNIPLADCRIYKVCSKKNNLPKIIQFLNLYTK